MMPLPPTPRLVLEVDPDYWTPTERELAVANHKDRQVAREVNADNCLIDATPFGSLPGASS